jgi:HlyD family secretion protein
VAASSAPTLPVIAADLKQMQVQVAVSEADIGRIALVKVRFHVDAFPEDEFEGVVSQVRLASLTVQNVVTYTVLVDAPNPSERLLPGMTADLNFEIDRANDVLLVPVSALRFEPEAEGGKAEEHGWRASHTTRRRPRAASTTATATTTEGGRRARGQHGPRARAARRPAGLGRGADGPQRRHAHGHHRRRPEGRRRGRDRPHAGVVVAQRRDQPLHAGPPAERRRTPAALSRSPRVAGDDIIVLQDVFKTYRMGEVDVRPLQGRVHRDPAR